MRMLHMSFRGRMTIWIALTVISGACAGFLNTGETKAQTSKGVAQQVCAITDHGASTGSSDNTAAINAAISACSSGGTVKVSGGAFKTGPLLVANANGLTIEVDSGSMLEAAFGPDKWPTQGGDYQDFLVFQNCTNCGLVGGGLLFGKGGRPPVGFDWYYLFDKGKLSAGRPRFVVVQGGSNFKMADVTLLDAPEFNVELSGVSGAEISGINITSTWYTDPDTKKLMEPHNTDGIDPSDGSENIWIHDVYIHNGDDSVAVKPGSGELCTQNVLVENCKFEKGHGCSIGSVGSGCVKNVIFRGITMKDQDNGCRVKTYSQDPGYVHNITWKDITMKDTKTCVTVNANYKPAPPNPKNFIDVDNLVFDNVQGSGCENGPQFICPEQSPCKDILLDDFHVDGGKMQCENAHGTTKNGVDPSSCLKD